MTTHWTNRSLEDYVFAIASDFIVQLENKMEDTGVSQDELAKHLGRSKGRISQMFNDPKNPTLGKIVEYSKALGMKVAIVAYEDNDPEKGLINSEIFKICWEKAGKPRDFWAFEQKSTPLIQSHATVTITNAIKKLIPRNDIRIQEVDMTKPTVIQSGIETTPSAMAKVA